jgi:NTE family protein
MSTALVFGGGGVTGAAWMIGLVAGWRAAGLDLTPTEDELLAGTSAGAVVAALVATGCDPAERYEAQLAGTVRELSGKAGMRQFLAMALAMPRARTSASARARLGRMGLAADTVPEAERRAVIAGRLPVPEWPAARLLLTAVSASTGEFRAFDRTGDASLVDAVAASCAVPGVWPPVTIGNERWIDGGMRSVINLDLAQGCDRVLVVAPLPYGINGEVRRMRRGAEVVVVRPDRAARKAMGRNALDPNRRPPAARAGFGQAEASVSAVRQLLRGK